MDDLTLITCSYETPIITETMLKSFKDLHRDLKRMNLIIIENSNDDETRAVLDRNGIKYITNKGGTHSKSIDLAFNACQTKYALIVDTDIIFKKNIVSLFEMIKTNSIDLCGIECGDRGGYRLMPRIHPWFMFVNVENIKKHGIKFHDDERIKRTQSEAFYNNIPINSIKLNTPMYDVGSTFYEDVKNAGLKIANTPIIQNWFAHYEGSSWQRRSGHQGFEALGEQVWMQYQNEISLLKNVDIKNFFSEVKMAYLVATAWVKNEAPYLAEWIEFHLLQGFEKFYIYDDNSTDNTAEVLAPYIKAGIVEHRFYPPEVLYQKNFWVMQHTINEFKHVHKWLFHHSIDEFIFCENGTKVSDFLKDFDEYSGVCLPWRLFTSNGKIKKEPGLIIERFNEYVDDENFHIKTIIDPSKTINCIGNPHVYYYSSGFAVYPDKVQHNTFGRHGGACDNGNNYRTDLIRINHYHVMSREEFLIKQNKGLLDNSSSVRDGIEEYWTNAHKGERRYETHIDKYIEPVKQNIELRFIND